MSTQLDGFGLSSILSLSHVLHSAKREGGSCLKRFTLIELLVDTTCF